MGLNQSHQKKARTGSRYGAGTRMLGLKTIQLAFQQLGPFCKLTFVSIDLPFFDGMAQQLPKVLEKFYVSCL